MSERDPSGVCAIVLCAGVGSRLRPWTDDRPKCLVPVAGRTMLARTLDALARTEGVRRAVIVTGYLHAMVERAVRDAPLPVALAHAEDFARTQNVVSLATGLRLRSEGEPWMKLDGDLLVRREVLGRLLSVSLEDGADSARVAVDTGADLTDEAMKVSLATSRITRFGKGLSRTDAAGESIGVEAFFGASADVVADAIDRAVTAGRTGLYYEDVYNDVTDRARFALVPVESDAWIEVDDGEDLARAEALLAADRSVRWD
jgi:choline kinase